MKVRIEALLLTIETALIITAMSMMLIVLALLNLIGINWQGGFKIMDWLLARFEKIANSALEKI